MYGEKIHDVVISGLSGLYPECDNVDELWGRLMRKEDMISIDGRRWLPGEFDVPPGTGKIKHTEYFDMTFFGIHRKLCEKMDPFTRLLCEQGYRAICDSGVNPRDLDGTNTATIMTSSTAETVLDLGAALLNQGSYNVLAFSRTMQANRLSYFLNLKGPSFQMDNTQCGGIQAIQYACDLISTGMCTAAIVGSCSLMYKGEASFHLQMMGRLSEDSSTRSFSSDASGFARSEGCVTLFLQRKEHAKRIYGTVLGTNVFFHGTKDVQFPGFPRGRYEEFLTETYKKANVNPEDVAYVEAYGSASKTLDALELNSLSKALLKKRSNPLLIGSIKSNLGHSEGCSSLVSLTKALMAMDKGIVPPNINYSEPNPDVPDLVSGKLKVVTEPTPLTGDTVAVCELGVTGNCAHIILKANEKLKQSPEQEGTKLPYILTMTGRNESALEKNMMEMENRKVDAEFAMLLNSLYKYGIKNHVYRGYTVISDEPNLYNMIERGPGGDRRPIWFMYSGMGSQWPTMAKSLMALPIFAEAINKCHITLEPKGINLLEIVCKDDPTIFDTILHSFVGIAAVQIGLTDVLRAIGVEPDGIIGHSVGELGCAYADGCMTAEQMILAAYARGRASIEATLIKGMMAAVGAGYNQMKSKLPETIEVACHNSKDSCTLSGPADDMTAFIAELKAMGMFAKLVNVANIAYHSQYIKPAAPALLKYLKEIIPEPVRRSPKWVSSSNLECNWDSHLAQHSSAEYHTNNLLSSVLFEEASSHIPSNAIIIEIAPHGLMQAIVKRSFSQAVHIPLTSRFDPNNLMFLLGAVGKMFIAGIPVDLQALYPTAGFPVGRGTPAISPLIDWSREVNFVIGRDIDDPDSESPNSRFVTVDKKHDNFNILLSHKINGAIIIPSSFYFKEMIHHFTNFSINEGHPIVLENVKFLGHCEINSDSATELRFQLLQGRGNIVVSNSVTNEIILEGYIKTNDALKDLSAPAARNTNVRGISHDVMVAFMKGLGVERDSSLISLENVKVDNNYVTATARWEGDIGKYLMSILALVEYIESTKSNALKLFHSAREIMINLPFLTASNKLQDFLVQYDPVCKYLQCEGIKISSVECRTPKSRQNVDNDNFFSFELAQFVPYVNNSPLSLKECVNMCTQLILENIHLSDDTVIKITEIGSNSELHDAVKEIHESIKYTALTSLSSFPTEEAFHKQCPSSLFQKDLWVVCAEPPSTATLKFVESIKNGFVMTPKCKALSDGFKVIFETQVHGRWYCLYAITKPIKRHYEVVNLNDSYLPNLKNQLVTAGELVNDAVKTVILWGQVDSLIAIESLMEKTKDLPKSQYLQYWFFHGGAPEYNFYDPEFKSQIERDVKMNILENGHWGSLRLLPSNASGGTIDCTKPSKFYIPLSAVAESQNLQALGLNIHDNPTDVSVSELGVYDYVTSNRIMGIGSYDQDLKTFIPDPILSWQKPSKWISKEAATVPLIYSLASYILHHTNNAVHSYHDSILVNRALLPLSQAVISLALYENMNVHATVYGEEEKQKLLKLFPKLNSKFIYDCSSVAFFVDVLKNTDGGVYKVINNFDDPVMIGPCTNCTLTLGVLIYTSQKLMNNGAAMGMITFSEQVVARGISGDILMNNSDDIKREIKNHITKAIHGGGVVPIQAVASLPPSTLNTEAVEYLMSNPNKVVVDTSGVEKSALLQDGSKPQVIVEGKIHVDLSLDILEWLLKRGSRKILMFSRQSHLSEASHLRLQSLREQYKCAEIEVRPSSQLSTKHQVEKFVEDYSTSGLAMIFFLGIGFKERIKLFDELSSRKLPDCNMICIGKGGENVCERRMKKSLPALHIRCSTANLESINLVNYLDSLIKESPKAPVVLLKKWATQRRYLHGLMSNLTYVPERKSDLILLKTQSDVSKEAIFVGIPSAGPAANRNCDVYPMFLIPGLRPNRLHKMASRLFCPTVEARIPVEASTIDQIADQLAGQLLALPHNMFTLCAEGWGGILALHVAAKLEAKSKYVNLVLLDASPASIIKWANSLLKNDVALLRKYLQISPGIESNIKNLCWEEELKFAVSNSESTGEYLKTSATDCLNLLRRRLQIVVDAKPPSKKLNIKCHVFGLLSHAHEDHGLGDYLLKEPTLHAKDSMTADDMIDNDVAQDVNTLLLYEHKDAANPPIEEYLDRNIVKKYVPHWRGSILYRVRV